MRPLTTLTTDGAQTNQTIQLHVDYNNLLLQLNDGLTSGNVRDLRYLCGLPAGKAEEISTGLKLFKHFESEGFLSDQNISVLSELFEAINRKDLLSKLAAYQERIQQASEQKQLEDSKKVLHVSKQPTQSYRPKPVQKNKQSTATKLLSPSHFTTSKQKKIPLESLEDEQSNIEIQSSNTFRPPNSKFICTESEEPSEMLSNLQLVAPKPFPDITEFEDVTSAIATPRTLEIEHYEMYRKPRGICLIISNQDFSKARENGYKIDDRPGTWKDEENLFKTFQYLQFEVMVFRNLDACKLWITIDKYARLDHSKYDCFVCCILTHGVYNGIYGIDGKVVKVYNIIMLFNGLNCLTLHNKPKIFFFQACRGPDVDRGYMKDDFMEDGFGHEITNIQKCKTPTESDYFIGYATPPGYAAWISHADGSWYITSLCDALITYAAKYDIHQICTKVNETVSNYCTKYGDKQIPNPSHTLTKLLYFFPEMKEQNEREMRIKNGMENLRIHQGMRYDKM